MMTCVNREALKMCPHFEEFHNKSHLKNLSCICRYMILTFINIKHRLNILLSTYIKVLFSYQKQVSEQGLTMWENTYEKFSV